MFEITKVHYQEHLWPRLFSYTSTQTVSTSAANDVIGTVWYRGWCEQGCDKAVMPRRSSCPHCHLSMTAKGNKEWMRWRGWGEGDGRKRRLFRRPRQRNRTFNLPFQLFMWSTLAAVLSLCALYRSSVEASTSSEVSIFNLILSFFMCIYNYMCTIICVYNHLTDRITRRDVFHEPVYTLLLPTILELHATLDVDLYNWQQTCLRYGPAGCMSWRHLMPRFRITWQGKKHRLPLYIFLFLKEREAAANRRISWYTGNDIKKRDGGKLMVLIMLCGALPENDISCLTFDAFLSLIYSSLVCHLYFPLSVFLSLPSGLTQKIVDAAFLYTWIIHIYTRRKNISTGRWQADNIQVFDCCKNAHTNVTEK